MNITKPPKPLPVSVTLGNVPFGVPFSGRLSFITSDQVFLKWGLNTTVVLICLTSPGTYWTAPQPTWLVEDYVLYTDHELILRSPR